MDQGHMHRKNWCVWCADLVVERAHHLLKELGYGAGLGEVGGDPSLMEGNYALDPASRGGGARSNDECVCGVYCAACTTTGTHINILIIPSPLTLQIPTCRAVCPPTN